MATPFTIVRVDSMPGSPTANTFYIVRENSTRAKLVFVGDTTSAIATAYTSADALADIDAAIAAAKSVYVFDTVAAMQAVVPEVDAIGYVKDASGEPTATTPTAAFAFDKAAGTWSLIQGGGGGGAGGEVQWTEIVGRPTASVAQIDQAVAQTHTHANSAVLSQLASNGGGQLTYNGVQVSQVTVVTDW